VYDRIPYQVKQGQAIGENVEKSQHTDFNKDTTNKSDNLDAFEMKGMRKILQFRRQQKTNQWVLNKAGVKRELLDTVKARKLAYYGHTMRKQQSCPEKSIMQETLHAGEEDHVRVLFLEDQVYCFLRHRVQWLLVLSRYRHIGARLSWPSRFV